MAKLFKVGGCVRDGLLGVPTKDIDFTFVCEASTTVEEGWEEMRSWMISEGFEIFLETQEMYTIRAKFPKTHVHAGLVADFVMARKEVGYEPDSRRPILELGTLEDDLIRRDFTVNAMAEDEDGNLIDLFNGQWALEAKMLITPRNEQITMMDDPLRLLRAFRFSITKGFTLSPRIWETLFLEKVLVKLEKTVSGERIREELTKMFHHDTIKTLELITEIQRLNPELINIIFKKGLWLKPTFEK